MRRTSRSRSIGTPDVRVRRKADAHGNRLPPDLVQRVGQPLELIVAGAARRPLPHVALPERRLERLKEVARERHVIGDRLRRLSGVDEIRRLPLRAVGAVDERDARVVEQLLERHRIFPILLDVVRVRLDALQSERGDSLDGPGDVVLPAPDGARRAEEKIRVDRVERLVIDRAKHLRRAEHTHRRCQGRQ